MPMPVLAIMFRSWDGEGELTKVKTLTTFWFSGKWPQITWAFYIYTMTIVLTQAVIPLLTLLKDKKSIVVLNKIDLGNTKINKEDIVNIIGEKEIIEISAKENIGIDKIYETITKMFELNEINLDNETIITNIRHKDIISNAIKECEKAISATKEKMPIDIIGIYIKDIMEDLGKITGESVSDEIIKEIFSKFCLGK